MKFLDFLIEKSALEYAADFSVTDDTDLPEKLAATFRVDDDDYVVIIYRSNKKGLYKVSVGQTPGKYMKLWKVKPQHLRVVIGTTLKIVNLAIQKIPLNMLNGIAIRLPDVAKPSHARILPMLIQKNYQKTMKHIPVSFPKNGNEDTLYLFVARRNVDIKKVFRSKEFKEYDFDETQAVPEVPFEALEDAEPRRKIQYGNVSKEPFIYKGFEVSIENETGERIASIKNERVIDKVVKKLRTEGNGLPKGFKKALVTNYFKKNKIEELNKDVIKDLMKVFLGLPDNSSSSFASGVIDAEYELRRSIINAGVKGSENYYQLSEPVRNELISEFSDEEEQKKLVIASKAIIEKEKEEETEKIINMDETEHRLNYHRQETQLPSYKTSMQDYDITDNYYQFFRNVLYDSKVFKEWIDKTKETSYKITVDDISELKSIIRKIKKATVNSKVTPPVFMGFSFHDIDMKSVALYIKMLEKKIKNDNLEYYSYYEKEHFYNVLGNNFLDTSERYYKLPYVIEKSREVESPVPISILEMHNEPLTELMGNLGSQHPVTKKGDEWLEKYHAAGNFSEINELANGAIYDYTGSYYGGMNDSLRNILDEIDTGVDSHSYEESYLSRCICAMEAYRSVKPIEEDVILWRGSAYPQFKKDEEFDFSVPFVDPGFLSTSTNPGTTTGFGGSSGGTRFMIIVPKGSKVIFANGSSSHSSEKEVILPPFSVLKPIKYATEGNNNFIQVVYIGNGMESYRSKVEEKYEKVTGVPFKFEKIEPKDLGWKTLVKAKNFGPNVPGYYQDAHGGKDKISKIEAMQGINKYLEFLGLSPHYNIAEEEENLKNKDRKWQTQALAGDKEAYSTYYYTYDGEVSYNNSKKNVNKYLEDLGKEPLYPEFSQKYLDKIWQDLAVSDNKDLRDEAYWYYKKAYTEVDYDEAKVAVNKYLTSIGKEIIYPNAVDMNDPEYGKPSQYGVKDEQWQKYALSEEDKSVAWIYYKDIYVKKTTQEAYKAVDDYLVSKGKKKIHTGEY